MIGNNGVYRSSATAKLSMGLDRFIYDLGLIVMQGSYGRDRQYDNLNEFFERNSVFHDLSMAFLELTFTTMFGLQALASLLFVSYCLRANSGLIHRHFRRLRRRIRRSQFAHFR